MKRNGATFSDGYRYFWNQGKSFWNRNGGKIMTVAGTTGLFLTGVHACRKTYKIHDELRENGEKIRKAKEQVAGEKKIDRFGRVVRTAAGCSVKTARHYLADAVAGGLSAYAVSRGWHKEHQNYQQAAAMVGVVMADFMNYRANVVEEHGAEADRRYLTTKKTKRVLSSEEKKTETVSKDEDGCVVALNENSLRIWYSRETTPQVWSDSLAIRIAQLDDIRRQLENDLIWGGSYSINDVRRYFYGRKGDIGEGGMYGRIWDPGDPEHPERGAMVDLHYQDDEDFMSGRTEGCWIIIDIDSEPLPELMKRKKERELGLA